MFIYLTSKISKEVVEILQPFLKQMSQINAIQGITSVQIRRRPCLQKCLIKVSTFEFVSCSRNLLVSGE